MCKQQKAIIDDILDLSKIDSKKIELNPIPFQVATVLQSVEMMFRIQLKQKNLILVIDPIDETTRCKRADPQTVNQIINNFVSNSIKITLAGGVRITAWMDKVSDTQAFLNISISDTGIGMTLEEQEGLFNRFAQTIAARMQNTVAQD